MAKLTFGKWQGWEIENLVKFSDGRSYLAWGAEKLQNPKLRKEFQAALDNFKAEDMSIELEAEAILKSDGSCDWLDAEALALEMKADMIEAEQREAAYDAARQRFFNALAQAGISTGAASVVFRMVEVDGIYELSECEKCGRIKFSSAAKRNAVYQAAIEFDGDLDNII